VQIDFTLEELATLDKAIQQLPYYVAAPLIASINRQIAEQEAAMDIPIKESDFQV
jgi:hypothetical protein